MAEAHHIEALKEVLRAAVSRFCRHDGRRWKIPILQTIDVLRDCNWQSVFFGGTLRSLLLSYLANSPYARPRDIDIVVGTPSVNAIHERFATYVHRKTRFGGLQLHRAEWQFDVWPLNQTWAFVEDATPRPSFEALPETTFFNVEAVAIELWPSRGRPRAIFSGNDQFFSGLLDRLLEINRPANPFPELCVVRSLVMANSIRFRIGPGLASYMTREGDGVSIRTLQDIQRKHYGSVRLTGDAIERWIGHVQECISRDKESAVELPRVEQLTFWPIARSASPCRSFKDKGTLGRGKAHAERTLTRASIQEIPKALDLSPRTSRLEPGTIGGACSFEAENAKE